MEGNGAGSRRRERASCTSFFCFKTKTKALAEEKSQERPNSNDESLEKSAHDMIRRSRDKALMTTMKKEELNPQMGSYGAGTSSQHPDSSDITDRVDYLETCIVALNEKVDRACVLFDKQKEEMIRRKASSSVSVNGVVISKALLKKAEKKAGHIHCGDYWYDFRAGFWGVMGQHGLGIIPPFIEEFNYPMPEKCSDGNTGVFVNGRELHQNDLTVLASRGLPRTPDRYIVDFCGKVLEERSRKDVANLGTLANEVQKQNRGIGMMPPSAAAKV